MYKLQSIAFKGIVKPIHFQRGSTGGIL